MRLERVGAVVVVRVGPHGLNRPEGEERPNLDLALVDEERRFKLRGVVGLPRVDVQVRAAEETVQLCDALEMRPDVESFHGGVELRDALALVVLAGRRQRDPPTGHVLCDDLAHSAVFGPLRKGREVRVA